MSGDHIADRVEHHANAILRAAGSSSLNHYMPDARGKILAAVLDCYEEAYRGGSEFTLAEIKKARGEASA